MLGFEHMFEELREIGREIRDIVSWIRREHLEPREASSLLSEIGRIENSCAAARVLLSGRISESKLWQEKGERSAAHFVAGPPGPPLAGPVRPWRRPNASRNSPAPRAIIKFRDQGLQDGPSPAHDSGDPSK